MADHQQDAGPVGVPAQEASTTDRLKAALFEQATDEAPAEEAAPVEDEISDEPATAEPVEGEELEADDFDEEGNPEGEQETAIAAPVSLNAEEKAAFAQLPEEAQSFVTALEARRNADVTKVTTKAADAQRAAEQQAAQAAIQAKQNFAMQLDQFVQNFAPQMPDPGLGRTNPAEYIAQKAQYDAQIGQFDQLKHQIAAIGQEAQQEDQRAFIEARDRALMQIPEIANDATRQDYLDRVFNPELVSALGYERSELAQIADAADVKRLNTIAGWREKAAKYDAAMKRKMEPVRAAKKRNTKPGLAQQQGSRNRALEQAKARQKATGGREGTQEAIKAAIFGN